MVHRTRSQLVLRVVSLLLRSLGSDSELTLNPLVSVLNAFRQLGERSVSRVVGTVLEVGRLLAGLSFQLVEGSALVYRLENS